MMVVMHDGWDGMDGWMSARSGPCVAMIIVQCTVQSVLVPARCTYTRTRKNDDDDADADDGST